MNELLKVKNLAALIVLVYAGSAYASSEICEKGMRHFRAGEYGAALSPLEECSYLNPDPSVYYMLGYSCYELNNHEKSREYFDQVYLIDPDFRFDAGKAANSLSGSDISLIHELLELSGAKKRLSFYAAVISRGLPLIHSGMKTDRTRQDILDLVKDAYKEDVLYRHLYEEYAAGFRRDPAVSAKKWLSSDIGMRLTGSGAAAGGNERRDLLLSGGVRNHSSMELVIKLEGAMLSSVSAAEIISLSMFELMKGMQSELQEQSSLDSADIDMLHGSIRRYSVDELQPDIMLSLMDICRDLTDEEIRTAIRFYSSPEGIWFSGISSDAYSRALGAASKNLGIKIGKTVMTRGLSF